MFISKAWQASALSNLSLLCDNIKSSNQLLCGLTLTGESLVRPVKYFQPVVTIAYNTALSITDVKKDRLLESTQRDVLHSCRLPKV